MSIGALTLSYDFMLGFKFGAVIGSLMVMVSITALYLIITRGK